MQDEIGAKIALFVREERKKRKLSQNKLAWKAGLTNIAIQNIENSRRKEPRISTLLKICKALGVPFSVLAKDLEQIQVKLK
ncbi:MAG: helix-turn-helix transcriptional regulator [Alphaproteobacteria bacterium]|nr:helix-turn-helix transcriptional regulator [Alphaproteobacteria bacterium]